MRLHLLCLTLLTLSALTPLCGQVKETRPSGDIARILKLPDFDIRDSLPRDTATPKTQTVEHRLTNLEALRNAPGGASLRLTASRYGLPKLLLRDGGTLTAPAAGDPEQIARDFLRSYRSVFPFRDDEVDSLHLLVRDDTANATFLAYNQTVAGIDVFNAQIKFTLTKAGEVVQASAGDVVPGLKVSTKPALSASQAACAAMGFTGAALPCALSAIPGANGKNAFGNPAGDGHSPITAELTILPMDADSARLAWRVFVDDANDLYELLVDAQDGSLLFRQGLTRYDAQARVWTESPNVGTRQLVTFPAAWLNGVVTSGNNADAFADTNNDDQPDANNSVGLLSGRAYSPTQLFDAPYGDGLTRQDPRNYLSAAITNLFYYVNLAHDFYYRLGFTEAAGNFQVDNLNRGGLGKDPVWAEAQQGGTVSNASFGTPADGLSPRMRVGIYTRGSIGLTDDLDADYDGQVIFHEYGHGVSNRLVGARTSTSCLSGIHSGAMGEGWSDYFAISYYNNPVHGGYIHQDFVRGSRRQSYEGYPYTYEDLGNSSYGYEVHFDGEIWAATLWDLRKSLGQTVTDQLVVNGLKSTPCSPSMIDGRDAILTADQATYGGAHRAQIWQVFARHGMGYSADGLNGARYSGALYNAAYDQPPDLQGSPNPRITSFPLLPIPGMGDLYTYRVTATNPAGGTLSYALTEGPAGMTINSSGVIQWTAAFTGKRVKITVTDGKGGRVVHGFMIPVETIVNSNTPIVTDGAFNDTGYLFIYVPPGTPALQVTLRGGTGDGDMYLYDPRVALYGISGHSDNTEGLSVPLPSSGYWQILLYGYQEFHNATFTANLVTPPLLDSGTPVRGLNGIQDSESFYRVRVPTGASSLKIATSGGTGDVGLLLKYGYPASCPATVAVQAPCYYDQYSVTLGINAESISIDNPRAGDYYIDLLGFADYAGVTLTASVVATPGLALTPSLLGFTVPEKTTAVTAPQDFTISSAGSPVFNWTAQVSTSSGGNWLSISRASGTGNATVQVTANPAGLAHGIYFGTVTILAPNLFGAPKSIPVILSVTAPTP